MTDATITINQYDNEVCEFSLDVSALAAVYDLDRATWAAQVRSTADSSVVVVQLAVAGYAAGVLSLTASASNLKNRAGAYVSDVVFTIDSIPRRVPTNITFNILRGVTR